MKKYKKALFVSVVGFVVSLSCCWVSALSVWLGGAVFIAGIVAFIESKQWLLLAISFVLLVLAVLLYLKHMRYGSKSDSDL